MDGAKKQVYLVLFLDDATRFVLHGQFYPTLDQVIVEDCFRQAIQKYGVPESVFFDYAEKYTMPRNISYMPENKHFPLFFSA